MAKGSLVIVESPAKAKTIQKYLGKGFKVAASLGHVKDLPKSSLGVDVENDFESEYEVIPGKEKVLASLKKLAAGVDHIYLAPDPDREGEAIAAHLAEELGGDLFSGKARPVKKAKKAKKAKKSATSKATPGAVEHLADAEPEAPEPHQPTIQRVTFNEITQRAVQAAFEHARAVDRNLVDAQQARRVLDRLVGYQVSPLLWDKVRRGLSAGRVQTVALRLIVDREREIKAFNPVEYWTLDATLAGAVPPDFDARVLGRGSEKFEIVPTGDDAEVLRAEAEAATWSVRSVEKKERRRNAPPPFTTSKLQQDSSRKLGFSVRRTMTIAQRLYEGIELGTEGSVGLITYMRTDSVRVSGDAITDVREFIGAQYGKAFLPETPNLFKGKKDAQDAHEAVRPTSAARHPDEIKRYLGEDEYKVYKLIWQRFVGSQMTQAVFDQTTVDIDARGKSQQPLWFRVTGSVMKFEGFLKVYVEAKDTQDEDDEELKHKLPPLEAGQPLTLRELKAEQHFTQPPPRFNEASLVKELEERGIGRPSTYAAILTTIQERQYVQKITGRFVPSEIGIVVTDLLVENFADIFDPQYTARLEEELDDVEDGKEKWTDAIGDFYDKFKKDLAYAEKHMRNVKRMAEPTEEKCERCGSPLLLKWGKHGSFFACSAYDKKDKNSCTFTKENPVDLPDLGNEEAPAEGDAPKDVMCGDCGRVMVLKRGRFGQFMACSAYPDCKNAHPLGQGQKVPDVQLDEICPKCNAGRHLVKRNGRYGEFISCSGYPECKYIKQNFIGVKCPDCADGELVEKRSKKGSTFYSCDNYPKCEFASSAKPIAEKCPKCGSPYLVEKTLKSGPEVQCPNKECEYVRSLVAVGA